MSLITIGSNLSILLDNGLLETLSSIVEIHSGDEDIITQVNLFFSLHLNLLLGCSCSILSRN